jgi:hypothetical protein
MVAADVFESDGSRVGTDDAAAQTLEAKVIRFVAVWRWRTVKFATVIPLVPKGLCISWGF